MTQPISLRERYGPWALVTGASSGIGEHFARQLAAAGLNLILLARREVELSALAEELRAAHGIEAQVLAEDLADPVSIERIQVAVADRDIGLLVSNAGFGLKGGFTRHQAAELDAMLNVNARAPMLLCHALLPALGRRPRGGIILTGSVEGEFPMPWSAAYGATKAFVHSLGLALWQELQGSGVDLLVLAPGPTDTDAPIKQGVAREVLRGLMSPAQVVSEALVELGRRPLHIPARQNRLFMWLLRHLPRRWALGVAGRGMAEALRRSGHPPL